jgi:pimeloyl-ACP methyl ester carboxylesterase
MLDSSDVNRAAGNDAGTVTRSVIMRTSGFLHELRNFALVLLIPFAAIAQDATPSTAVSAAYGNYSDHVNVGDRSLYLTCEGKGTPTVILESGSLLMTTKSWDGIQDQVAKFTRVCSYDRANAGKSSSASGPRSAQQMADDLDALLTTARVPGPYVLASFSFGSLVSRLYASQHPDDVAGMVLIDPLSEELEARWQDVLTPELWSQRISAFWLGNPEQIALDESYDQIRNSGPLPEMPLLVLVHSESSPGAGLIPDGWPAKRLDPIWQELVAAQAGLVPGGALIVAKESGHDIPSDQPELVVMTIRSVVWPPMTPVV